jgi:AGCS family alanine or glycine:cation symporter
MQRINDILTIIDSYFGGSQWFVFLLLGTGLFYTLYLGFPQMRFFRHAIRVLSGKYDSDKHIGDASHFQALSTALSGTIGTGNIAGVALAIHLGGPSAIFWMLVTAFVGMTTKLVEVTLSHKYREQAEDGSISGGPMYYMKNRLKMRWLAALFAIATICSSFGTGCLPQINSISNAIFSSFGIHHYITGAVLAVLLALIVIGGIKRIVKVSERLVPFMSVVYVLGALSVLIFNYQNIIPSVVAIFGNIFTGTAAGGGFLGATVAF